MRNTYSGFRISFAVFALLFCGNLAGALGIEASKEGTPIDLTAQKLSPSAELINADGSTSIRVIGITEKQNALHLFDLEKPIIDSDGYAVFGEVRYEGIEGEGRGLGEG